MKTVGLIGARGYVGREVVRLVEADPGFSLALATSRELCGKTLGEAFEGATGSLTIEQLGPEEVAARRCDAYVLGLPNGLAAPYVEAIEAASPDSVIVDLSADYRDTPGWTYGLPELGRAPIRAAKRIANPGCYATAAILALWPVRDLFVGIPSAFGVSGYSGAGTTPGPKNDPARLRDNVLPYGFGGHGHQHEITRAVGHPVAFAPHVAQFFRGLIVTCTAPLALGHTLAELKGRYRASYADSAVVRLQDEPPEPAQVAGTAAAVIGGMALDEDTNVLTVACAHDNLLKGAASQAMENLRLAFGMT
ncbi:N-acetyl-gamma-glutamyl-phosphate reductase [Parvularcula dongshanensis]|uniref:N-acetyl-gamma-glutamyl-phosphate reductase common form n=1 Tax=Parvularcula dongshanensis TaxID=1173995 RepID=A0A840I0R2_9PROT|nr:N-acetyl-gamma-glutamyl-phosphate reductase [Parvularcula dongshanensis]MBB4658419.1 N-acetyl-gamma-glutamyl-phosphate reductase common form [Parvularcula dongshanensis]